MADKARQEGDINEIYTETMDYAFKMGDSEKFRMSRRWDYDCKSALEDACEFLRAGMNPDDVCEKVLEEFGADRCGYVLAATVKGNDHVEFSPEETEWAEGIKTSEDKYVNSSNVVIAPHEALSTLIAHTQKAKEAEIEAEKKKESAPEAKKTWLKITLPKSARMGEPYEKATMFRMPKGDFLGSIYYLPNSCVTDKGETLEVNLSSDFSVTIRNKGEETKVTVSRLKSLVEGKEYLSRRGSEKVSIILPDSARKPMQSKSEESEGDFSRMTFNDGKKTRWFFCNDSYIKEEAGKEIVTVSASRNFTVYEARDKFEKMTAQDLKTVIDRSSSMTK